MENPALSERRKIDALGTLGLADPSQIPAPMLGFAQARLGGESPALSGLGAIQPLGANDSMDIDFAPAGLVPDFGWLGNSSQAPGGATGPALAPAQGPGQAGPADPLSSQQAQGNEGSWGPEDEAMLEKALSGGAGGSIAAPGESASASGPENSKYDQIFGQFGQSKEGNCASVAVIKAALDKFDGKVFQSVQKSGDGYDVTQQDGKKVTVTKGELQKAAKAADFKGKPNEAKSMAVLMFATIAKRGASEGMGSFDQALKKLDSGFDPKKAAQLLGLGNRIKEVDPSSAGQKDGVVAWNSRHAVYMDEGKTDSYGQAKSADGTDTRGSRLTQAFTFA